MIGVMFSALTGCGGMYSVMSPFDGREISIKTVKIRPLKNTTAQAGIEMTLMRIVAETLGQKGFSVTDNDDQADGFIEVTLRQYDENMERGTKVKPATYEFSMIGDMRLLDRKGRVVWNETAFEQKPDVIASSKEAVEKGREQLFRDFSVSLLQRGQDQMKTESRRDRALPENPPAEYPSTAPF